eukprot:Plantae.Rhodophyta-Hildenbrandia_rubra.ctg10398.p1 GENE.Plantae.Rhodophyta-Hildenbrandia_rubra.ctg10398~~Plantae.Rhodophyta-Hildenbrandia_rubra.ctg10398.p1  ORF type:complete len:528 (-),score=46.44 Plantae.Rhodophyta-Hildenbrandia_rubra.ctg10398:251-1834(-)
MSSQRLKRNLESPRLPNCSTLHAPNDDASSRSICRDKLPSTFEQHRKCRRRNELHISQVPIDALVNVVHHLVLPVSPSRNDFQSTQVESDKEKCSQLWEVPQFRRARFLSLTCRFMQQVVQRSVRGLSKIAVTPDCESTSTDERYGYPKTKMPLKVALLYPYIRTLHYCDGSGLSEVARASDRIGTIYAFGDGKLLAQYTSESLKELRVTSLDLEVLSMISLNCSKLEKLSFSSMSKYSQACMDEQRAKARHIIYEAVRGFKRMGALKEMSIGWWAQDARPHGDLLYAMKDEKLPLRLLRFQVLDLYDFNAVKAYLTAECVSEVTLRLTVADRKKVAVVQQMLSSLQELPLLASYPLRKLELSALCCAPIQLFGHIARACPLLATLSISMEMIDDLPRDRHVCEFVGGLLRLKHLQELRLSLTPVKRLIRAMRCARLRLHTLHLRLMGTSALDETHAYLSKQFVKNAHLKAKGYRYSLIPIDDLKSILTLPAVKSLRSDVPWDEDVNLGPSLRLPLHDPYHCGHEYL